MPSQKCRLIARQVSRVLRQREREREGGGNGEGEGRESRLPLEIYKMYLVNWRSARVNPKLPKCILAFVQVFCSLLPRDAFPFSLSKRFSFIFTNEGVYRLSKLNVYKASKDFCKIFDAEETYIRRLPE